MTARARNTTLVDAAGSSDDDLAVQIARRSLGAPADPSWHRAEQSFLELYDRYAKQILAYLCRHGLGTDADDVAQDIWQRVWDKLPARQTQEKFRAWLFSVAHHRLVDFYRTQQRRKSTPLDASGSNVPGSEVDDPSQAIEDRERRAALEKCLEQLDPAHIDLVRRRWQGATYQEICLACRLDKSRAYRIYHDASQRLTHCMHLKGV